MKYSAYRLISRFAILTMAMLAVGQVLAASDFYDHIQHGFDLRGAHAQVECADCHIQASFQGTPSDCAACHNSTGVIADTGLTPNHIATTEFCDACHLEQTWLPVLTVDHAQTMGNCSSCHNGLNASETPPGHVPTSAECGTCHLDQAWIPAQFDHANIVDGCSGCHNGIEATGKNANHIQTSAVCESCHSVDFWEPVI
ncbi:MAG: hypothetical protein P8L31_04115, partial [Pseudomonadales bacterium]|nr:hypothetical protein [Pseudomonadales bacterium]